MVEQEAPSWETISITTNTERFHARSPRDRTSTYSCWSSYTGFWPDKPTSPSTR